MPVALSYRSSTAASSSSGRAGRTLIRSDAKRLQRPADSLLERRRLPAELALRLGRVGRRVPEEEVELAARQERRAPDHAAEPLARGRDDLGDPLRQLRGDAAATGDANRDLGHLPEGRVAI